MSSERIGSSSHNTLAEAIRHMGEDELRFLNRLIIERLKLVSQAKSTTLLAKLAIGDQVTFVTPAGERKSGVILRLNKKTASVRTDDGHDWKVHPSYLTTVIETTAVTVAKRELGNGV